MGRLTDHDELEDEIFEENESPTRRERKSPEYRMGLMMKELVELRKAVNKLNKQVFGRQSIKPQVQTAGVAAIVAGLIAGIIQALNAVGIIK